MNNSICLLVFMVILIGPFGIAQINSATNDITPSKALIIFTRESWGCLNGQEVKEDVSAKIAKDDCNFAIIQEIKNPEDIFNRYELYLIFPAKPVNGLTGNFVVKFWCNNDKPETKAYFSMDHARLYKKKGGNWILSIRAKGNGFIHAKMLYSRAPEIRQALFSCPEAGVLQPNQLTFFNVYPLEGNFDGVPQQKLGGKWQTLELTLNPIFLEGAVSVDKCQTFLDILDKQFAVTGRPMVWERKKIQAETIQKLSSQTGVSSEDKIFQVLLKADDGTMTKVSSYRFLPHLRQKLALKNPDGKLIGAELWLRAGL